jgi:hypothetical protein
VCEGVESYYTCEVAANGDVSIFVLSDIGAEAEVSVALQDSEGNDLFNDEMTVSTKRSAPNGEGCEPVCYNADVEFTAPPPTTD